MATYYANDASGLYQYCNGLYGGPKAVSGDTIILNSGMTFSTTGTNLQPDYGVSIVGNVSITVNAVSHNPFQFVGSGTANWYNYPVVVSGLQFNIFAANPSNNAVGTQGWIGAKGLKLVLQNVGLSTNSALTSSRRGALYAEASSGVPIYVEAYGCNFGPVGSSIIVTRRSGTHGGSAQESYIKLYDCNLCYPGLAPSYTAGASDVALDSRGGLPIYVYGGSICNGPVSTKNGGNIYLVCTNIQTSKLGQDINGTVNPSYHGTSHDIMDLYVLYGSNIVSSGLIKGNPYDGTSTNKTWDASQGQSRVRSKMLINNNVINVQAGNTLPFIENTLNAAAEVGSDFTISNNVIVQGPLFSTTPFLIRQYPNTSGVNADLTFNYNTIIGNGNTTTAFQTLRITDSRMGSPSYPYSNTFAYNTWISTREIITANSMNVSGVANSSATNTMLMLNNIVFNSGYFINTSGTNPSTAASTAIKFHKYGSYTVLGNIFNFAQPEGLTNGISQNGNEYTIPDGLNLWSTTPGISGRNYNYTINTGGNVTTIGFTEGVTESNMQDCFKQIVSPTGIPFVGSKVTPTSTVGNIIITPSVVVA